MVALEGVVLVNLASFWLSNEGLSLLGAREIIIIHWLPKALSFTLSELQIERVDLRLRLLPIIRLLHSHKPDSPIFGIIHHYNSLIKLNLRETKPLFRSLGNTVTLSTSIS